MGGTKINQLENVKSMSVSRIPISKDKCFVYGVRLAHDLSYEYRYVGLTSTGIRRMKDHLSSAVRKNDAEYHSPKYRWMRKHYLHVQFDILEVVFDAKDLPMTEVKWITILRSKGHRLLNLTDGGEGAHGLVPSVETRRKMSEAKIGTKASLATRRKMSISQTGKKHTVESRLKMSEATTGAKNSQYGKVRTRLQREAVSAKLSGRKHSEDERAKNSAARIGKPSKGSHTRWHVNRGMINEMCIFCQKVDIEDSLM